MAAETHPHIHPCLLVKERDDMEVMEVHMVAENHVIMEVPPETIAAALLAAYYSFNMEYPRGLKGTFLLLEKLILEKHSQKEPRLVTSVFASLSNMD